MTTYYYRCQRCKRIFSRKDDFMQCTSCNQINSKENLVKTVGGSGERGWFKGEKYL